MEIVQDLLLKISEQSSSVHNTIKSLTVLLIIVLVRMIVNKYINKKAHLPLDQKRKLIVNTRNVTVILYLLVLLILWGSEIKGYALSVAAVAVAITMSFKEMITNFMGGVARTISHPFQVGNRITVGSFRGDVIDTSMLTTTILEIGPGQDSHQYTGSSISIPNSLFLANSVVNESFVTDYLLHIFSVVIDKKEDCMRHEKCLLEASKLIVTPYLNKARNYMEFTFNKLSVEPPSTDPRVIIMLSKPEEVKFLVRVPVPAGRKLTIEQEIIRKYIELLNSNPNEKNID